MTDMTARALLAEAREYLAFQAYQTDGHMLTLVQAIDAFLAQPDSEAADRERLDWIELCIRDGSHVSILNDIIAACHVAYQTFGPGPAIRTAIDAYMPDAARGEPRQGEG